MARKSLYQREDGSFYLFSEDQFNDHLSRALAVVAAYNELSRALSRFEDLESKITKEEYFLGILFEGGEVIRNEYRKTLERELKGISFFKTKRAALIEESVQEIPAEIFQAIEKSRAEARRESSGLSKQITREDLVLTLSDDSSCFWVSLSEQYKEDLKASLVENVPEDKIKKSQSFLEAMKILRQLDEEGAYLLGHTMPGGGYVSGIMEGFMHRNAEGKFAIDLTLDNVVTRLGYKRK